MILLIKLCLIIICFVCLERIVEILLDSDYYFEQKIANYFSSMSNFQQQILACIILSLYLVILCLLVGNALYYILT